MYPEKSRVAVVVKLRFSVCDVEVDVQKAERPWLSAVGVARVMAVREMGGEFSIETSNVTGEARAEVVFVGR